MAVTRYFLGGNTASGFVSFYGQFCRGPEDFLWVIKGGPGCGKSSFMKTIGKAAENAGLDVEYVLCSGDPDSVDGVYLPALHTGYADGTAPHVLEASRRARRDCISIWGSSMTVLRCKRSAAPSSFYRRATARSTARRMRVL